MFKKLFNRITTPVLPATVPVLDTSSSTYNITVPASTTIPSYVYSSIGTGGGGAIAGGGNAGMAGNIVAANPSSWITLNSGMGGQFAMTPPAHIITFSKPSTNQEIVKLNLDGSVTWANGIDVDAAAEAFGQSLQLSAEMKAGISKSVKLKMRDSVFEDLINIAKEKGSLTAEDLTYLLEASKIVEKLKGGN